MGDVNTYALFAESFFTAISLKGRAGFIVPSGIATDDSTKYYFQAISQNGRLASLLGFDNAKRIFPAVHPDTPFSLVTLGPQSDSAELVHYALSVQEAEDSRRRFTLTPDEFRLINPNTRTCPVFRSQRDAELTKKLYRAAPVLIREAEWEGEGKDAVLKSPDVNRWGIRFSTMFHMSNDSHLFADNPTTGNESPRLPLCEAKMVHQFDHRWATYVDSPDQPHGLDTDDVSQAQKEDPAFTVRPRYWVDERELPRFVGARIHGPTGLLPQGSAELTASGACDRCGPFSPIALPLLGRLGWPKPWCKDACSAIGCAGHDAH